MRGNGRGRSSPQVSVRLTPDELQALGPKPSRRLRRTGLLDADTIRAAVARALEQKHYAPIHRAGLSVRDLGTDVAAELLGNGALATD